LVNTSNEALKAIWELQDKQALAQIATDESISLLLREKAKQYLKNLETGG